MNSARLARRWQESSGDYARMAEALNDEITEELATKADLRALESALKTEIAEVRTEIAEVRTEIATLGGRLEAKIESTRAEIIKWVGGMIIVQMLAILGIVRIVFVP